MWRLLNSAFEGQCAACEAQAALARMGTLAAISARLAWLRAWRGQLREAWTITAAETDCRRYRRAPPRRAAGRRRNVTISRETITRSVQSAPSSTRRTSAGIPTACPIGKSATDRHGGKLPSGTSVRSHRRRTDIVDAVIAVHRGGDCSGRVLGQEGDRRSISGYNRVCESRMAIQASCPRNIAGLPKSTSSRPQGRWLQVGHVSLS